MHFHFKQLPEHFIHLLFYLPPSSCKITKEAPDICFVPSWYTHGMKRGTVSHFRVDEALY